MSFTALALTLLLSSLPVFSAIPLDASISDGRDELSAAEAGRLMNLFTYDEVELSDADQRLVLDSLLRQFHLTDPSSERIAEFEDMLESWATMNEIGRLPRVDFESTRRFLITYQGLRAYVALELVRARERSNGVPLDDELASRTPRLMYETLLFVTEHSLRQLPDAAVERRLGLQGLKALGTSPRLASFAAVRDQFRRFLTLSRERLITDVEPLIESKTNLRKLRILSRGSLAAGVPLIATLIYFHDLVDRQPLWVNSGVVVLIGIGIVASSAWMESKRRVWAEEYRRRTRRGIDACERALGYGVPFSGDGASTRL